MHVEDDFGTEKYGIQGLKKKEANDQKKRAVAIKKIYMS